MSSLVLLLLPFAALASAAVAPAAPPPFDPIVFFAGRTEGTGDMKIILRHTRHVRVHGNGAVQPDGSILLSQTVDGAADKQQNREWRIRRIAPGRYTGSLTEARGEISGESTGNAFHLKYRTKGGTAIEQWITPSPDGRSARNRLIARKMGIVVGHLNETIRKTN